MSHGTLICELVLTDEQLKAVGCLAIESTRLETHVEQVIIDHCGTVIGSLLIERKMLDAKVDLLKSVFSSEFLDKEHAAEFEQLYGEIKSDIPRRNTVIHGSWEEKYSLNELMKMDLNIRNAKVFKKQMEMTASEVMDLALRFGRYQVRLVDWYMPIREHYDALHGTSC